MGDVSREYVRFTDMMGIPKRSKFFFFSLLKSFF
jgi:hypothetical protein